MQNKISVFLGNRIIQILGIMMFIASCGDNHHFTRGGSGGGAGSVLGVTIELPPTVGVGQPVNLTGTCSPSGSAVTLTSADMSPSPVTASCVGGSYTATTPVTFSGTGPNGSTPIVDATITDPSGNTGSGSSGTDQDDTMLANPPVANDDNATTPMDTPVNISVDGNDTDLDGDLDLTTIMMTLPPPASEGTVTLGGPGGYDFTFTPAPNFVGTTTYEYQICDSTGLCDTAVVTVVVTGITPVATNDEANGPVNTPISVNPLTNDSDGDGNMDPSTVVLTGAPPVGGICTGPGPAPNYSITFTPDPRFVGTAVCQYEVCDVSVPTPLCSNVADVTFNVGGGTENNPVANDDNGTTPMETPITINVDNNDNDSNGDLNPSSINITTQPPATEGICSVGPAANYDVIFMPAPNFAGESTCTYEICDMQAVPVCDTADVVVTVIGQPPVATNDDVSGPNSGPITGDPLANDTDPDNALDPSSVAPGTNPQPPATSGVCDYSGAPNITFTPTPGFVGPVSCPYQVCDTTVAVPLCDEADMTFQVTDPSNTLPLASDDADTTPMNTAVVIDVDANDTDGDGDLDPTTVSVTTPPPASEGTVSVDPITGDVTFTPAANFVGTSTFEYEICDLAGQCAMATVTVVVTGEPPTPVPDVATGPMDTPATVNVTTNDTDPNDGTPGDTVDPGTVTITNNNQPDASTEGTCTADSSGNVTFTPVTGFVGLATCEYEVCDTSVPTPLCNTSYAEFIISNLIITGPAPGYEHPDGFGDQLNGGANGTDEAYDGGNLEVSCTPGYDLKIYLDAAGAVTTPLGTYTSGIAAINTATTTDGTTGLPAGDWVCSATECVLSTCPASGEVVMEDVTYTDASSTVSTLAGVQNEGDRPVIVEQTIGSLVLHDVEIYDRVFCAEYRDLANGKTGAANPYASSAAGSVPAAPADAAGIHVICNESHYNGIAYNSAQWGDTFVQLRDLDFASPSDSDGAFDASADDANARGSVALYDETTFGDGTTLIGTVAAPFTGTYEGESHKAENFVYEDAARAVDCVGLIGCLNGATLNNWSVDMDAVEGREIVGLFGKLDTVTLNNVNFLDTVGDKAHGTQYVGYLAWVIDTDLDFKNITVDALTVGASGDYVGFIARYLASGGAGTQVLKDITINELSWDEEAGSRVGMFAFADGLKPDNMTITNLNLPLGEEFIGANYGFCVRCDLDSFDFAIPKPGTLNASAYAGAVAGRISGSTVVFDGAINTALASIVDLKVECTGANYIAGFNQLICGGVFGWISGTSALTDIVVKNIEVTAPGGVTGVLIDGSSAVGAYPAAENIGGLAGSSSWITTENIKVNGVVKGVHTDVAGVFAQHTRANDLNIEFNGEVEALSTDTVDVLGASFGNVGGIYGFCGGCYMDNVINNGKITTGVHKSVGGVAGAIIDVDGFRATLINSSSTGDVICGPATNAVATSAYGCGGLLGSFDSNAEKIENSFALGNVTADTVDNVGGLVGGIENNGGNALIKNSYYGDGSQTITSSAGYVGGLVGHAFGNGATITIEDSYAHFDTLTAAGDNVGGFIGYAEDNVVVADSYSKASAVTGNYNVGGFLGYLKTNSSVENAYAEVDDVKATTTGSQARVAGFAGTVFDNSLIQNSYSKFVNVTTNGEENFLAAGFVAYLHTATIENILAVGEYVEARASLGGAVGRMDRGATAKNAAAHVDKVYSNNLTNGSNAGGFVGQAGYNILISNAYAQNVETKTYQITGGFVGSYLVGSTVAAASNELIENSYVENFVTHSNRDVLDYNGGFVGSYQDDSKTSTMNINGVYAINGEINSFGIGVGGIIGRTEDANLNVAFAKDIDFNVPTVGPGGIQSVGGIMGDIQANSFTNISDTYAIGHTMTMGGVRTTEQYGGILGGITGTTSTVVVDNSWASYSIPGTLGTDGGVCSSASATPTQATINNSFYDNSVMNPGCGGTGLSPAGLQTAANFTGAGWNAGIWNMVNGSSPTLVCPAGWAPGPQVNLGTAINGGTEMVAGTDFVVKDCANTWDAVQ